MSTAFRLKTFPEILSNMFARGRGSLGADVDLNPGSVLRTIFEATSLQDADQYVQIAKLLDLFSLDTVQGDDLDRRAADYGSEIFTALRRRPANTSISKITVSDGTLLISNYLDADVVVGSSSFTVVDGSEYPTSGAVTLDVGTPRSETVVYTRVGDTFTLVSPATLASGHATGASVIRVSTKSITTGAMAIGDLTFSVAAGTGAAWPAFGDVVLDRNTVSEELLAFTRSGDVFTIPACAFAHAAGMDVYLSTAGSNRAITAGSVCYVPATDSSKQVNFTVGAVGGTLYDGDFTSGLIDVTSQDVGYDTRVGSNTITRWQTAPFTGATVTNPISATRGADREPDSDYRQRIRDFIQSLSRATPLAITTGVNGLQDPDTGAVVTFAQVVEPVTPGVSYVYISDGTATFALDQNPFLGRDVLIRDAETGDARGRLGQYGPFAYSATAPYTPRLFASVDRGVATSVGIDTITDTTQAMVINAYTGFFLKTDDDVFYEILSNTAVAFTLDGGGATPSLGSYSVYNFTIDPLVPGTDFQFNEATGDVELTTPLVAHDGLVAAADGASPSIGAYTYTSGLGAYAQRVINGDPTDFDDFPGLRAAGTKAVVIAPTVISQTFTIQVLPSRGFTDDDVEEAVTTAVETYVNSLGIGKNVIIAEIIAAVKNLVNIDDVTMINPTANVTVPDGQIMRIASANVVIV
jgi:uncharacterized phage protein gp47/JayE